MNDLARKADLALSDLATAGVLNAEQSNRFFRKVVDESVILRDARFVPMRRPQMEINKIGFTSRILRAASQAAIGSRALASGDRSKPATSKITLTTKEVIAEVDLPYETIEDNIEGIGGQIDNSQFTQTILDLIGERVSADLEELLVQADTVNGVDAYMQLFNGALASTTSNIVNHNNAPVSVDLFSNMIQAVPTRYHRFLNQYRFYVSTIKEIQHRTAIAQRNTGLGDATLTGTNPVPVLGVQMKGAAFMPNANALLTVPKNLIWGVQRDVRLEFDRDVRERYIIIVVTLRVATAIEEEDMGVKATNIG